MALAPPISGTSLSRPPTNGGRQPVKPGKRRVHGAASVRSLATAILWLVLLAMPFAAPNDYLVSLANLFLINVILIASLNLLMGYGGQISLGHAGFFGLGAYVSGILSAKLGLSAWIGLPAAMLTTGLAALVIGIPVLRLRGLYLSMATLGWNAILVVLFNRLVELTGGPNGLLGVAPFSIGRLPARHRPARVSVGLAGVAAGHGRHSPRSAFAVRPRAPRRRHQ